MTWWQAFLIIGVSISAGALLGLLLGGMMNAAGRADERTALYAECVQLKREMDEAIYRYQKREDKYRSRCICNDTCPVHGRQVANCGHSFGAFAVADGKTIHRCSLCGYQKETTLP